jgi:two-component system, chemotaxis family, CheB/CheR fusion protein
MANDVDPKFEELLEFIKEERGFDFTGYKRPSLLRRIRKRMDTLGIEGYDLYLARLQADPDEFTHLFDTILINVTSFFRDPAVWDAIGQEILPRIFALKHKMSPIRVWCAGSASGEEAYSIAVLLAEQLGTHEFRDRVKIFATDVDEDALAIGRHAWYSNRALQSVPHDLLEKYFSTDGNGRSFAPELRRSLIFGRHDVVQDAPISRTDLVLCRNTIMYMNTDTQERVIANLAYSLNDGGFLVLGKSEMLFSRLRSFAPMDLKRRVFVKVESQQQRERLLGGPGRPRRDEEEEKLNERLAFDLGPVAQIVVDDGGRLSQINRRARDLLGLRQQDVGKSFHELQISYRPVELRSPMEQAQRSGRVIAIQGVVSKTPEGRDVAFDIQVVPLTYGDSSHGSIVTFTDVTDLRQLQEEIEHSNQELETAMEELQSTNEELETTNEELQSSNEELETTNEELQSSNEELETTNEELQSTNEELETMNEEMRERTLQVADTTRFMDAVMGSLRAAVIVLGPDLRIQVWNALSQELWGLRETEVKGQLLNDLDVGFPLGPVQDLVRRVLTGDDGNDASIDAVNRRGQQIRCLVTATRLSGDDGQGSDGVILIMRPDQQIEG